MALVGALFHLVWQRSDAIEVRTVVSVTFAGLLLVAIVLSVFGMFTSLIVFDKNHQVTEMELKGTEWLFENRDPDHLIDEQGIRQHRFYHRYYGTDRSNETIRWEGTLPPDHYNYTVNERFGQNYDDDGYLPLPTTGQRNRLTEKSTDRSSYHNTKYRNVINNYTFHRRPEIMSNKIEAMDTLASKLRIRPLAARAYWKWRKFKDAIRSARYKLYRLRNDTYRVTVRDAQVDLRVLTEQEYYDFVRLPERPILEDLLSKLRPDDVFYDIGANLGLYSCLVADVVKPEVVAFEPHPKNADRLVQNAESNGSEVSVQRVALADSAGSARMKLAPGFDIDRVGSAGHTLLTDYYEEESDSIAVTKERGDEFVAREDMSAPTVLKIDTEGTEMDVLKGFDSTLARSECRLVYCEVHEDRLESQGNSVSDVSAYLESHGFSVEKRSIEGYQTFVCGEKN